MIYSLLITIHFIPDGKRINTICFILLINDLFLVYSHIFILAIQRINGFFYLLHPLSTVHCPLSAVHCPLSPVHCPLSTVHRLLSIIYCQYNTCLDHFPLLCALVINKDLSICFIPSWQIINAIYFILLINDLIFIYSHLFYTDWPRNKRILFYFINKWFILHFLLFILFQMAEE